MEEWAGIFISSMETCWVPFFMAQFKAKYYTMTGGKQEGQKSYKIKYEKHHQTYVWVGFYDDMMINL